MNNITIIGNICREPDVINTTTGKVIAKISVAVPSSRKNDTDFFTCVCYEPTSDFVAKFLTKGCKVAINGAIHIREYERKDGTKGKDIEIDVRTLENLTPKEKKPVVVEPETHEDNDDDLPWQKGGSL